MCTRSQQLYFDSILTSLPVRGSRLGSKLMAVFEIYLDESGIHEGAKICVVAGFYGKYSEFRKLENGWCKVVAGLPDGDFHAHQFFARDKYSERVGPYKGWSDKAADAFMDGLVKSIRKSYVRPVRAYIDVEEFNQRSLDERVWLTFGVRSDAKWKTTGSPIRPHSVYYSPFESCVTEYFQRRAKRGSVLNAFYDQNTDIKAHLQEMWELFQKKNPHWADKCGPLFPVSRKKVKIVQAADLLAYLSHDHLTAGSPECRRVLRAIVGRRPHIFALDKHGINIALQDFVPPRRKMANGNPSIARADAKRRKH